MIWVGVSGSWRASSPQLEKDLERFVNAELNEGNAIVTGGALGVDYMATQLALRHTPDGSRLKVILPVTLKIYAAHFRKRAAEGVITTKQAESLIAQLTEVQALGSLAENHKIKEVTQQTYYLRDTEIVNASDKLLAFQVNKSAGTQDTIDKARARGIPVKLFSYIV